MPSLCVDYDCRLHWSMYFMAGNQLSLASGGLGQSFATFGKSKTVFEWPCITVERNVVKAEPRLCSFQIQKP